MCLNFNLETLIILRSGPDLQKDGVLARGGEDPIPWELNGASFTAVDSSEAVPSVGSLSGRLLLWKVGLSGTWERELLPFWHVIWNHPAHLHAFSASKTFLGSATTFVFVFQVFLKLRSQIFALLCNLNLFAFSPGCKKPCSLCFL